MSRLLLLVLSGLLTAASLAQTPPLAPPADSLSAAATPAASPDTLQLDFVRARPTLRFKVYPRAFWSPSAGFGVGGGVEVEHLLTPGSRLVVAAQPAMHRGRYFTSFVTAEPRRARRYGVAHVFYETTGRQWFYGLGPASTRDTRVGLEKEELRVEGRVGFRVPGTAWHLQPSLAFVAHRVNEVFVKTGSLATLSPESRAHLASISGPTPEGGRATQRVLAYGAVLLYDARPPVDLPRHGVLAQLSARRFEGLADLPLAFDRYGLQVYGFVPVGRAGRLGARLIAFHTNPRGTLEVPFYFRPQLGHDLMPAFNYDRFYDHDLLHLGVEYRQRLFDGFGIAAVDAVAAAGLGQVYDDLFDDFEAGVTFEKTLAPGRDRYPLRPAVGAGLSLIVKDDLLVTGMIGLTPERFGVFTFGFVHDLRDLRPDVGW